jgi:alkylation response protein AidB-like acyl-CoA dehydrogenase
VLGEVGKGYKIAIETLNEGTHRHRRADAGAWPRGALEHAVRYTQERKQFGKAIAEFQGVQFQLARAATDDRGRAAAGLQRRASARRAAAVSQGSGDVQAVRVGRWPSGPRRWP